MCSSLRIAEICSCCKVHARIFRAMDFIPTEFIIISVCMCIVLRGKKVPVYIPVFVGVLMCTATVCNHNSAMIEYLTSAVVAKVLHSAECGS